MTISPFHFNLKKVSARDESLLDAVYAFLPATGLRGQFAQAVREAISKHLGEEFSISLESCHQMNFGEFASGLPSPAVMAVVGLVPLKGKAVIEIDHPIAMLAIERLLGGQAISMPEPKVLSDTEQGVLQYLLLQVLANIYRLSGQDARVHFRFDRFAFQPHDIRELSGQSEGVAVLTFRIILGRHAGFIRLVLPNPFVEEALLEIEGKDEERPAERAWRLSELSRFGYVRTWLTAEAGRTSLFPSDLSGIEEGDVILFDEGLASVKDGRPAGNVLLRIGDGLSGGIEALIVSLDGGQAKCRVLGIHKGE